MAGQLPDFELEAENNRGVRNKYAFRLVDGKVEMVKEESMDGVGGKEVERAKLEGTEGRGKGRVVV